MSLAVILITAAGLLAKSFIRLQQVDIGIETRHLLTSHIAIPVDRYRTQADIVRFYRELLLRARSIPGVEEVALSPTVPPQSRRIRLAVTSDGGSPGGVSVEPDTTVVPISPNLLHLFKVPLIGGRYFSDSDGKDNRHVGIISARAAQVFFGGTNAIGKHLKIEGDSSDVEIVGVVRDVLYGNRTDQIGPTVYVPFEQYPYWGNFILIKTQESPAAIFRPLQNAIANVDPEIPIGELRSVDDRIADSVALPRFRFLLLGLLGLAAALLTFIGIYGTITHYIAQRRTELAIRAALGSSPGNLNLLLFRSIASAASVGIMAGLLGAVAISRMMVGMLFNTAPLDLEVLLFGSVFIFFLIALAVTLSARSVHDINPAELLRN